MNYKRMLLSVSMIAFAGAIVVGATGAFFSDTETSTGNTFTAGAIDLTVGNDSYLVQNGVVSENASTTWQARDLEDGDLFFDFADIKPGDLGEDTITLNVNDNDSWMCADLEVTENEDNGQTEPEAEVDQNGTTTGELAQQLEFFMWADDGDNVYEQGETPLIEADGEDNKVTFERFLNGGVTYPIADSQVSQLVDGGGPLAGGEDYHIGKAWCLGSLDAYGADEGDGNPQERDETGISCEGADVGNETQTDSLSGNVSFTAVQSRNNDGFVCEGSGEGDEIGCVDEADVMMVLDSSGSISGSQMDSMKQDAKSFISTLGPTQSGINIGVVDFDGDGEVVQGLTDDVSLLESAIDGMDDGGSTNMTDGINDAQTELASNGRTAAPDFMIVLTDGEPDDETTAETAASDAGSAGTTIFAIGVGSGANENFLKSSIATSPTDNYFSASDFDNLQNEFNELLECPAGADSNTAT